MSHITWTRHRVLESTPGHLICGTATESSYLAFCRLSSSSVSEIGVIRIDPTNPNPTASLLRISGDVPRNVVFGRAVYFPLHDQVLLVFSDSDTSKPVQCTLFDATRHTFISIVPTDANAWPMSMDGFSLSVVGYNAYLFGGSLSNGQLSDLLYCFDCNHCVWARIARRSNSPWPIARKHHASCSVHTSRTAFAIMGGESSADGNGSSDLWFYDPYMDAWELQIPSHNSEVPIPRSAHGMLCLPTSLAAEVIVFGGKGFDVSRSLMSSSHIFHPGANVWTKVSVSDACPQASFFWSFSADGRLFMVSESLVLFTGVLQLSSQLHPSGSSSSSPPQQAQSSVQSSSSTQNGRASSPSPRTSLGASVSNIGEEFLMKVDLSSVSFGSVTQSPTSPKAMSSGRTIRGGQQQRSDGNRPSSGASPFSTAPSLYSVREDQASMNLLISIYGDIHTYNGSVQSLDVCVLCRFCGVFDNEFHLSHLESIMRRVLGFHSVLSGTELVEFDEFCDIFTQVLQTKRHIFDVSALLRNYIDLEAPWALVAQDREELSRVFSPSLADVHTRFSKTLKGAFLVYATLDILANFAPTWTEMLKHSATMSSAELLMFCTHFDIVPQLMHRFLISERVGPASVHQNSVRRVGLALGIGSRSATLADAADNDRWDASSQALSSTSTNTTPISTEMYFPEFLELLSRCSEYLTQMAGVLSHTSYFNQDGAAADRLTHFLEDIAFGDRSRFMVHLKRVGLRASLWLQQNGLDAGLSSSEGAVTAQSDSTSPREYVDIDNEEAVRDALQRVYLFYASFGDHKTSDLHLSQAKFMRLLRDAALFDPAVPFMPSHANLLYSQFAKGLPRHRIDFDECMDLLRDVAVARLQPVSAGDRMTHEIREKAFSDLLEQFILPRASRIQSVFVPSEVNSLELEQLVTGAKFGPSIRLLFRTYSAMESINTAKWTELDATNVSLSLAELMTLAVDFQLVPSLVSKSELFRVFRSAVLTRSLPERRGNADEEVITDVVEFGRCLARIASVVYSKYPYAEKYPTITSKCEALFLRMHLDNYQNVRAFLEKRGYRLGVASSAAHEIVEATRRTSADSVVTIDIDDDDNLVLDDADEAETFSIFSHYTDGSAEGTMNRPQFLRFARHSRIDDQCATKALGRVAGNRNGEAGDSIMLGYATWKRVLVAVAVSLQYGTDADPRGALLKLLQKHAFPFARRTGSGFPLANTSAASPANRPRSSSVRSTGSAPGAENQDAPAAKNEFVSPRVQYPELSPLVVKYDRSLQALFNRYLERDRDRSHRTNPSSAAELQPSQSMLPSTLSRLLVDKLLQDMQVVPDLISRARLTRLAIGVAKVPHTAEYTARYTFSQFVDLLLMIALEGFAAYPWQTQYPTNEKKVLALFSAKLRLLPQ